MPKKLPRTPKTYIDWRNRVLARDLYICQECGRDHCQVVLCAHHLKAYHKYPELSLKVENGTTLCVDCHKKHHKRGWKNGTP